jgi:hypothetical protein
LKIFRLLNVIGMRRPLRGGVMMCGNVGGARARIIELPLGATNERRSAAMKI